MIVCIAEKPSVAKDIARILGATTGHEGYMEGNGYQVTWTFGHLCTLKEPNDYTPLWKHWSLSALPMIPKRFGIKLIDDQRIFAVAILQGIDVVFPIAIEIGLELVFPDIVLPVVHPEVDAPAFPGPAAARQRGGKKEKKAAKSG